MWDVFDSAVNVYAKSFKSLICFVNQEVLQQNHTQDTPKKFLPTLPDSIPGHMYDEHFSPDNKVIVWLPWTPHSQQCTTYYTELKICIQSVPKCETSHCHTLIVTAQELFLQASCSLYLSKALLKLNCFITKIIFIVIFMSLTMW